MSLSAGLKKQKMRQCCSCESAEHGAEHGEVNPASGGSGDLFVIAHQRRRQCISQPKVGSTMVALLDADKHFLPSF